MPPQMTPQCQETDGALHATCACTARTEKGVCSQEASEVSVELSVLKTAPVT